MLRQAGHDVLTVEEANLTSTADENVLDAARRYDRILLTQNCEDFSLLHDANPSHPGILAIYSNRFRSKDLSYEDIIRAIANLEVSNIPLKGKFIVLNAWNYRPR